MARERGKHPSFEIAFVGDSHFHEKSRFEECIRLHRWIADDLDERGVAAYVHTGDVYHARSTVLEREAVSEHLIRVAAQRPVVVVKGNHEVDDDLEIMGRLRAKNPIHVVQQPTLIPLRAFAEHRPFAEIACLPWPRESNLIAHLGANGGEMTREAITAAAREALRNVLRRFADGWDDYAAHVLAAHAMVGGAVTSTGQPLWGHTLEVGLEDLALAGADLVALGHIHKAQDWNFGDLPIAYTGSPRRTDFGELEEKSYVLASFDHVGRLVRWSRIPIPATPMLHVGAAWGDGRLVLDTEGEEPPTVAGAEVRLRYFVPPDHRPAAAAKARELAEAWTKIGAVSVKIEEVVKAPARMRAPEIAAASGIGPKLRAFWAARGEELGGRADRLVAMAEEIKREEDAGA